MRRGEIWWGRAALRGRQARRRPLLIVSDDAFNDNPRYPKVLAVHLTSVRKARGAFDWEVEIPRGVAGLDQPSVVKCAEVYTLWKDQLESLVGALPRDGLREVDRALAVALGLPVPLR